MHLQKTGVKIGVGKAARPAVLKQFICHGGLQRIRQLVIGDTLHLLDFQKRRILRPEILDDGFQSYDIAFPGKKKPCFT